MTSPVVESFLTLAAVEKLSTARNEPEWLLEKRRQSWEQYENLPMPNWTRGIRGWWSGSVKELDLNALQPFTPAGNNLPDFSGLYVSEDQDDGQAVADAVAGLLVQYNSEVVKVELSEKAQQAGVIFTSLEEAVRQHPELVREYFMTKVVTPDENKMVALHAALWSGGAFLYVPDGVELAEPFRVVFYADVPQAALFSHVLVVAGKNSRVKVVEEQISDTAIGGQLLDSNVVEIYDGNGSQVEYYNPQEWGENVFNFSTKRAFLYNDSLHRWIVAVLGSEETKLDLESVTVGPGSRAEIIGAIFPTHDQNHDLRTLTRHTVAHTTADALFKAALMDRGQYGFQGKIRVDKAGKFTESFLGDHVLFLSEDSKADALPSLDVDANDVRCSHGQTIGMVDDQQIFYMMTRGLSRQQATEMIVSGFFEAVTDRVPLASVRERLRQSIGRKVAGSI